MTPMMRQYWEIKKEAADCILFFRLGDFYEMFEQDALTAAEMLGITLTARSKGDNRIPMCGIPYHSAAGYIAKLTRAGRKVAICEQVSDPSLPGIVKREIVRVITPGTTVDENVLDDKTSNYLLALGWTGGRDVAGSGEPVGTLSGARLHGALADALTEAGRGELIGAGDAQGCGIGLAWVEASTGEFFTEIVGSVAELVNALKKYRPREVIYDPAAENEGFNYLVAEARKHFPQAFWHVERGPAAAIELLEKHFGAGQSGYGQLSAVERGAAGLALGFLSATQKTQPGAENLRHLKNLAQRPQRLMTLDENTIAHLEILENAREKKLEGSLLDILDKTVTSAGGRLIKKLIVEPLADLQIIENRLMIIDFFLTHQNLLLDIRLMLKKVMDIERILGRLNLGSGNARDLRGLINSFQALTEIRQKLDREAPVLAEEIGNKIDLQTDLMAELERAIVDEPPFSTKEGGLIRPGFHPELDELRGLSRDGKNFIAALQAREIERSGINSLKVKFNKVFGYYIEISNANLAQVPPDYTRKQTLANAERFTTPELKEYEEKILTAEEKITTLEARLFEELRQKVLQKTSELKTSAAASAYLDVMSGLALTSWENRYVRPQFTPNYDLKIVGGRHPVIEKLNPQDKFIPNDTMLTDDQRMILITGPNMGGKSTFLRQTALIVLMAHLGMYVPADSAEIPLVDRIFTRVGASDNLVKGQSTFWLEMEETATILGNATEKSLIVLDEIGRGTSTFDGVSIAWGIMEFLHEKVQAKTLFASHYHELIKLADTLPRAANFSVKVEEHGQDGVTFLYTITPGGINRSYGIQVAKLAGLPEAVITRAREILQDLEKEQIGTGQQSFEFGVEGGVGQKSARADLETRESSADEKGLSDQLKDGLKSVHTDFGDREMPVRSHRSLEELKKLDLNTLTPLEALNKLHHLKTLSNE